MEQNKPSIKIINHVCKECGFVGGAEAINGKVKCPSCGTVNDVWLLGETPPPNHLEEPATGEIVIQLRAQQDTRWDVAADRLESQAKLIAEKDAELNRAKQNEMVEVNMQHDMSDVPDDELYQLALEKRKNGNASPRAYAAQCEIARRKDPYKSRYYRNGSSKRYAHNQDYMNFETDNR